MISDNSNDIPGPTGDDSDRKEFDQPASSGLNDQERHQYLMKVLEARRYIDEFFFNKFGFPAYPCLDILLIGSGANDRIDMETIASSLSLAPSTAKRHLDLMLNCDLVTVSDNGYMLTASARELLTEFVEKELSTSFMIAD